MLPETQHIGILVINFFNLLQKDIIGLSKNIRTDFRQIHVNMENFSIVCN